ncbi:MAG: palindromic element RPE4 domain-containing protein [Janthinobacterium lividum]|nr:palindromic element RPE4 domain-containing protein [Rickettsia endosymbiont of Stiretrus anchorago]HJD66240.1 palindromic element RPE4 domain-containing protein [Rickettsia endosymbiont of Bembidion nr. Transversale]
MILIFLIVFLDPVVKPRDDTEDAFLSVQNLMRGRH